MDLQHAYGLSDAAVLARWVENPYFQHCTGETVCQHRLPIIPPRSAAGVVGSAKTAWRGC